MIAALSVLSEQWISHLWAVSWQVSILFAIIWIVEKLSFRASSLFRYWLWMIVLVRLCIPLNLAIPGGMGQRIMENIGIGEARIQNILVKSDTPDEILEFPVSSGIDMNTDFIALETIDRAFSNPVSGIAGIAWLISIIAISAVILFRIVWIKRRLKQFKPVERADLRSLFLSLKNNLCLGHSIELFEMDTREVDVPSVIGVLHPKVFLPRSIVGNWPIEDIEP
ncbi:M56 family metallopeptidase [Candidatus Latescibacterota bacterium]